MPINVKVYKDAGDHPGTVEVKIKNKTYTLTYDPKIGFTLDKDKIPEEVFRIFSLIFPVYDPKTIQQLLDKGRIIRAGVTMAAAATTVLYTVPQGHSFYLLGFDLDVQTANGAFAGSIFTNDNLANQDIATFEGNAAAVADHLHTSGSYNLLKMPPSWSVRTIFFGTCLTVCTHIIGVEV